MKRIQVVLVAALLAGAAACSGSSGGDDGPQPGGPLGGKQVEPAGGGSAQVSKQDIIDNLHLRPFHGVAAEEGRYYVYTNTTTPTTTECLAIAILTTKYAVSLYYDGDDNVAVNLDRSLGIRFMGGADGSNPDMIPACGKLISADLEGMGN